MKDYFSPNINEQSKSGIGCKHSTPFAGRVAMRMPVSVAADAQAAIRGVKSVTVSRGEGVLLSRSWVLSY